MPVAVTHQFVSPVADEGDPNEVGPNEWNAEHTITGLGTAAEADSADFATAAQGAKADTALQTASDSPEINFTVVGQDITASLIASSIDESKLDASVNASLDLADTALQSAAIANMLETADIGVLLQAYSANLDEYAAVNPTAAGLALLDDANAAAQLVTLGLTATAAELNVLDGITATVTELNYADGLTSAIQTQLDGKQRVAWLDVKDYGTSGAGILDDAPEIMAAIAVADTIEGGGVLLSVPSDHYQISSAITIDGANPVTLLGVGQPELRTDYAGAAISVGAGPATEQGYVTLKDFKLWGDAGSVTGIRGQFAVSLLLDGLSLYQIGTLGAYLSDCYSFLIDRCQFNECGDAGLYLTKASMNRGVISRSKFINHGGAGQCGINMEADGSVHYGGLITGCDFEFNTNGIRCADISGLHIADCYFEENDFHILATTTCDNIKITDCQFLGPGVVDLSDVDGVTLDNLVFYGTGTVLDLTGCTNVTIGRLYFPNGGVVVGLDDQRLVGHYSSIDSALNQSPRLQVHTISAARPAGAFYRWSADTGGPSFSFAKSRGAAPGTNTIVQADDGLGSFIFRGNDGSGFWNAASFGAAVDGTPGSGDMPGRLVFSTSPDASTTLAERARIDSRGFTSLTGSFGRGTPVTKTADFTVAATENWLLNNKSGSSCTVTLPTASAWTGREITIKNLQAQTVVSASSNVGPLGSTTPGTAILSANAGRWATLVSDGTTWHIMAGVV